MALSLSPASTRQHQPWPKTLTNSAAPRFLANQNLHCTIHLHRSSPLFSPTHNAWPGRCSAASPGSPPPPESDPPTGKEPTPSPATFARLQDTVQIFFAVLFWMSLFFWASAWDGRNNGRPSKGSRFRK